MAQNGNDSYRVGDRVYVRDRGFGHIISIDRKSNEYTIVLDSIQGKR